MTNSEKASAFASFNDDKSNVKVLLLNTMVGAAGLNLHGCCHFGIQVQMPWSYGSSGQYLGRLVRLKQSQEVTWVMLRVNDTVYDFVEHKACQKEAQAFSAYLTIPKALDKPIFRKLLSYEVLRAVWSQPFNRIAWEVIGITEIQDFNSKFMRACGYFYHHLALLLLREVGSADEDADDSDEDADDGDDDKTGTRKDLNDKLEKLEKVFAALPTFWCRKLCRQPENPEASELPDALSWDMVDRLLLDCEEQPDVLSALNAAAPTTEFGSLQNRKTYMSNVMEHDNESLGSSAGKKRKRNTSDNTPSKRRTPRSDPVAVDSEDDDD
ncbi:hypothetical protein KVR01_010183 [Diaporthe batatas]|uniref:uncharacterized protein n=1 Tax=Diaporthe batatas TaxID=748121 RepID=UPI001D0376FD|nr:uncharacterized protein KVR01_010183 [Diaporthe batatas]KAG8159546.1 hypothetical protein KVR01_010183 [Diaporthe batatas]